MSYLKLSIVFILALCLWSCKKDNEEPTLQDTAEGGALVATIDGVEFIGDNQVFGDLRPITEGNDTLLFFVSGEQIVDGKENVVQVVISDYKGVGTYGLGTPTSNVGVYFFDFGGDFESAASYYADKNRRQNTGTGTLEITEETTERIKGTFEFTGISETGKSKFVKGEFSWKRQ